MNSHSEEEDRSDAKSLKQRENPRSLQLLTSTALVHSRATLTVFLNNNRKIQKKVVLMPKSCINADLSCKDQNMSMH